MFNERIQNLAQEVVKQAIAQRVTVGTAESCTGGLVSGAITSVAGSSAALMGGVVSYDSSVKHRVLGVDQAIIDDPALGVVSAECAAQMALGARDVLGCDIAVSITGIAGPGGAEPGKPVGTVWFGLSHGKETKTVLRTFSGSREDVRLAAVGMALELLCEGIAETRIDPA